jgi:predicted nucleic acid-binding protein
VKLYLDELGSDLVRDEAGRADHLATSALAYVETRSALARRRRAGDIAPGDHRAILLQLDAEWPHFVSLEVTGPVLDEAARLADQYVLRPYDAVHLASALALRSRLETSVVLGSWDDDLDAAARREGFLVLRERPR